MYYLIYLSQNLQISKKSRTFAPLFRAHRIIYYSCDGELSACINNLI